MTDLYIAETKANVKPYAIYLRKSRADIEAESLGEGETLARHRKILTELAKRRKLPIAHVYAEVVSGESIDARPEMQQLLTDVRNGNYSGVLVVDIDRLGRGGSREQGIIAETFADAKCAIITPTKDYDTQNEADITFLEFGQFMSRQEYKLIRKRLERGRKISVQEGNYLCGLPPFGYDKAVPHGREKTLVINETEAQYVKMIFDMAQQGNGAEAISMHMTKLGVQTRTGSTEWKPNSIRKILHNPVYCGKIKVGERKTVKVFDGNATVKKRLKTSDFTIIEGRQPAIITTEQYDAVQNAIEVRTHHCTKEKRLTNPLAGLVRCAKCGRVFTLTLDSNRNPRKRLQHSFLCECRCRSVLFDDFMPLVIDALKQHVQEVELRGVQHVKENNDEMISTIETRLRGLDRKQERLYQLLETEVYSVAEFTARRSALVNERIELEKELNAEREKKKTVVNVQEMISSTHEAIDMLADEDIPAELKNKLLRTLIDKIEYWQPPAIRSKGCRGFKPSEGFDIVVHFK